MAAAPAAAGYGAAAESTTPKSHYWNLYLFACVRSWQGKMVPGYTNSRNVDLKNSINIKKQ